MYETVHLSDPRTPLRIEYSRAAMQRIRERARQGLMAVPRVPIGVGGLLLGVRDNGLIRILDSVEIPCAHSSGPGFTLTAEELLESREMVAEANALSRSSKVSVVGWYCSKVRGDATLSDADLVFYKDLFPQPWQVALVARPSAVEPMRAAFYVRDAGGALLQALECIVEDWRHTATPAPEAFEAEVPDAKVLEAKAAKVMAARVPNAVSVSLSAALTVPLTAPPPAPVAEPPAAPKTQPAQLADIVKAAASNPAPPRRPAPRPAPRPGLFGVPGLEPPRPSRRRGNTLMIVGAAAAVIATLGAAFMTRDAWLPKPPLVLSSTELNGSLLIRWNPEALRGIDHASILVNDGGQPTPDVIPLDSFQLNSGLFTYTPKSPRVSVKLDAGDITAMTAWFAAAPPKPVLAPESDKPAAALVPQPAPAVTQQAPVITQPAPTATHPAVDEVKPKP
jgi:proteasome lid subunit RPN8/RPN11